jgi:hypothetical protein
MRNRSLKSELTNILSLYFGVMNDQFPNRIKARLGRLRLPEFQVKRPVHILQPASTHHEILSHISPVF